MQIITSTSDIPSIKKPVITIGSFDGLHHGHMEILQQIMNEASKIDGQSVVITFHPHPKMVVGNQREPIKILTTIEEKTALLAAAGIDYLIIIPFTEKFSQMSAAEYLNDFLIKYFKPHTIVIGHDHRFGMDRTGDYVFMEKFAKAGHFQLIEITEQLIRDNTISSTSIRKFLNHGKVEEARLLLGRPYFIIAKVIAGQQIGRSIGFPTANLEIEEKEKLIPQCGVYAVSVAIEGDDKIIYGMMNIGTRPTVSQEATVVLEVHLLGFERMIYNHKICVHFISKIRDEIKFDSIETLKMQLEKDRTTVELALSKHHQEKK